MSAVCLISNKTNKTAGQPCVCHAVVARCALPVTTSHHHFFVSLHTYVCIYDFFTLLLVSLLFIYFLLPPSLMYLRVLLNLIRMQLCARQFGFNVCVHRSGGCGTHGFFVKSQFPFCMYLKKLNSRKNE